MDNCVVPLVDCRGLQCPLPIIKVRLQLNLMGKGDRLVVYADDVTFEHEILRFCQLADVKLLDIQEHSPETPDKQGYVEYLLEITK